MSDDATDYPAELIIEATRRAERRAALVPRYLDRDERASMRALIAWLRELPPRKLSRLDYWHTQNETFGRGGSRARIMGGAEGVAAGVSDLIVARPGLFRGYLFACVAIELKRPDRSGRASAVQLEWIERRRQGGWIAEVCHGDLEAIELLSMVYGW